MSLIIPAINIELYITVNKPPPKDPTQEKEEGIKDNGTNKVNIIVIYYSKVNKSTFRGPTVSNIY